MHTSIAMEQGADALLINHTQDAAPLPPTLRPPPFTVAAQNARKQGISAGTALTIFVKDATAGAQGILSPTALRWRLPRWQNRKSGMSSATGTVTGESAKELHGSL